MGEANAKAKADLAAAAAAAASAAAAQAPEVCSVCCDGDAVDDDPLHQCERCRVSVHRRCYGLVDDPSLLDDECPFLCAACAVLEQLAHSAVAPAAAMPEPRCALCPVARGALKRTTDGAWCHVFCAHVPQTHAPRCPHPPPALSPWPLPGLSVVDRNPPAPLNPRPPARRLWHPGVAFRSLTRMGPVELNAARAAGGGGGGVGRIGGDALCGPPTAATSSAPKR